MPYVTPGQIQRAKRLDLLTYLQTCEPHELVRLSDHVFTTRTHDSLKISNGKWNWWSRGIGGRSALDYLIKVRGMTLPEAVLQIDGQAAIAPPVPSKAREPAEPRRLLLPEKNKSNDRVIAYLTGRGIHSTLIDYCIQTGRLYESRYRHNAVFVGFDRQGLAAGKLPLPGGYLQVEKEHRGKHPARRFDAVPQRLPANNRNYPASGQRRTGKAGGGDHQGPPSLHLHHFRRAAPAREGLQRLFKDCIKDTAAK